MNNKLSIANALSIRGSLPRPGMHAFNDTDGHNTDTNHRRKSSAKCDERDHENWSTDFSPSDSQINRLLNNMFCVYHENITMNRII